MSQTPSSKLDDTTRRDLEAAAFRRLVAHLQARTDVQNIDLMTQAGFCRNCLSNWLVDAAGDAGVGLDKESAREMVYGMSYDAWKARYQSAASAEQVAAFASAQAAHGD